MTTVPQKFRGLGVCGGIAFGRVHVVDRRRVSVPHYHVPPERRAAELERFESAIVQSERQFGELRRRAIESGLSEVEMLLEAHALVLRDEALRTATRDRIQSEGQNAEWALKETVKKIKQIFDGLDEDYFRERRSDVDVVGDRLLRNLVGAEVELLNNLSEDAIVVAYDLSPADTVALARFAAKAFVTETGGRTSHTAILARALDVTCVLGVHGIMEVAGTGDDIVVDGTIGEVVLRPTRAMQGRYRGVERRRAREEQALLADRDQPAATTDGVKLSLLGNIEVAKEVDAVISHGGEGIGLYRTEFLIIEHPMLHSADEHHRAYQQVVRALEGRTVTIRTVDIGGDKFVRRGPSATFDSSPTERSSALGLRAIRLSLSDVPRFKEQIEGILRVSGEGQVRMLLPFVTSVEELRQTKSIIAETKSELRKKGVPFDKKLALGVMIETPGAVAIADLLAKECDFLAIGTNDLIQYSLAIDRANDAVAHLYRPCHPAVLRMIKSVCDVGRRLARPVTLCGEMAGDPFHAPLLVGLGLRTLSMNATSIPLVKRLVRRLSAEACESLVQIVLEMPTATDVEHEVARRLKELAPELVGRTKPKAVVATT
ncbi:phosphoenolpyruvate--protein phosphotransferase [Myxococcota bacterium]|nr:phosphoenolpyruvate--protein phosphotransferase [Myxococcota bacterium]